MQGSLDGSVGFPGEDSLRVICDRPRFAVPPITHAFSRTFLEVLSYVQPSCKYTTVISTSNQAGETSNRSRMVSIRLYGDAQDRNHRPQFDEMDMYEVHPNRTALHTQSHGVRVSTGHTSTAATTQPIIQTCEGKLACWYLWVPSGEAVRSAR